MKKVLWIFALIALTFVGDRLGGYVLGQITKESGFRYSRLYSGKAEADILLIGNSRGLIFYQPYIEKITGNTTFNLSYNAMPMDLAQVLVEDYLDQYKAPKLMIIDVTMCDRLNPGLISSFGAYASFSPRLKELILEADPKMGNAYEVSHLLRYNSEIFQRALFYLNKTDENWLMDRVILPAMVDNVENAADYNFEVPEKIMQSLQETIKRAESKGVEVRLVINPYYPPYAKKIVNLQQVIQNIESATGLTVHDYSLAVSETKGFGDYQHLNKLGSQQFLDKLKADQLLVVNKEMGERINNSYSE